jgi:hypothetical protein
VFAPAIAHPYISVHQGTCPEPCFTLWFTGIMD